MEVHTKFVFAFLLLVLAAFVKDTTGDAIISGTVFCDQCRDGQRSLFDYPLSGRKVRVTCDSMEKEETTNWFGIYSMRFEGSPDLSRCYAHLLLQESDRTTNCGAAAGPAQQLRLMFQMFNMEMYTVDSLLSQPSQPTASICPRSITNPPPPLPLPPSPPSLPPSPPSPPSPTPSVLPPPLPLSPPSLPPSPPSPPSPTPSVPPPPLPLSPPSLPPSPPSPPSPTPSVPPPPLPLSPPSLPPSPPSPSSPTPSVQGSACTHEIWTRPEYRCHWRFVHPDTKVAVAFGLVAAARYGTDISLWQGIQGRGDIYRTLLREGTTALLNSYNSMQFAYPTLAVLERMNWALMSNSRQALLMALRFKRANSGYGNASSCNLTPCNN